MQTKGTLKDAARLFNGKYIVTFEMDDEPFLDDLKGDLDIEVKRHREKRSLNANAYFHVLASKIAEKTGMSLTHEKNRLIREYGQWDYDENGHIQTFTVKDEYEDRTLDMPALHVGYARREGNVVVFGLMRGSHTYNTAEMARLIDATIEEAKELGIETATPDQLKRMMAAWDSSQKEARSAT